MFRFAGLIISIAMTIAVAETVAESNLPKGGQIPKKTNSIVKEAEGNNQDEVVSEDDKVASKKSVSPDKEEDEGNDMELLKAQLESEFYKETTGSLKWALGIMVTFFILFLGYLIFRREKEYKEALKEIRSTLKEARETSTETRRHADSAREWEAKAQEKVKDIEESVNKELEKIRKEGKRVIDKTIKEAERQREISELWNEGVRAINSQNFELAIESFERIVEDYKEESSSAYYNWGTALVALGKRKQDDEADELYRQAFEKYAKAVEIKKDSDDDAYNNWGAALIYLAKLKQGDEADELYRQAFEKCAKAVEIKKDKDDAYSNWGVALIGLAKNKTGENRDKLFKQAEAKLLEAESIKPCSSSYNLACLYALNDNEDKCREWFEKGEEKGTLPTRQVAEEDDDLNNVKDKDWFKRIKWSGE